MIPIIAYKNFVNHYEIFDCKKKPFLATIFSIKLDKKRKEKKKKEEILYGCYA